MAKFEVTIYVEGTFTIKVEAEDEKAAKKIADDEFNINEVDYDITDVDVEQLDDEDE